MCLKLLDRYLPSLNTTNSCICQDIQGVGAQEHRNHLCQKLEAEFTYIQQRISCPLIDDMRKTWGIMICL
jgi:hypothetical protein